MNDTKTDRISPPSAVLDTPRRRPTLVGRKIDRYLIEDRLGEGGQGAVYRATDTELKRTVALKLLARQPSFMASENARLRLLREAETASRLDHRGICTVYDVGEFEGLPYVTMQFIDGETVSSRIRTAREGPSAETLFVSPHEPADESSIVERTGTSTQLAAREIRQIVAFIEETARALDAAHEAGLVHRDVKPGNLMIAADDRAVVLDFGLARDENSDEAGLTETGGLLGTAPYMSPEQLNCPSLVDRRTDVYSLGVTLYECLTLRRPFREPTRTELFQSILTRQPRRPRTINRHISRDLEVVVETAMEKDVDRRYQSAASMADDLSAVLEGRPITARRVGWLGRTLRWVRRHPRVSALLAISVIGLATVAVLAGYILANRQGIERDRQRQVEAAWQRELDEAFTEARMDRDRAAELFRAARAKRPDDILARVGEYLNAPRYRHDAALALGQVRIDTWPEQHAAVRQLLELLYLRRLNRFDEATALEHSIPRATADPLDCFLRAVVRAEMQDSMTALRLIRRAVVGSRHARLLFHATLADIAASAGEADLARDTCDAMLEIFGEKTEILFAIGATLIDLDPEAAVAALERALAVSDKAPPEVAGARVNIALALSGLGRHDEARRRLESEAAAAPDSAMVHANLAVMYLRCDMREKALAAAWAAVRLSPGNWVPLRLLGHVERIVGDPDAALETLERALRIAPGRIEIINEIAIVHIESERWEEAADELEELIEDYPGSHILWLNLAIARKRQERWDEAGVAATRAVELGPNVGRTHGELARIRLLAGRRDEAVRAARRAIRLEPVHAWRKVLAVAAVELWEKGDRERGIALMEEATEQEPDFDWLGILGEWYRTTGRAEEALACALRVADHHPVKARGIWYNIAQIQHHLGRFDDAVESLDHAESRAKPGDPGIPEGMKQAIRDAARSR